MGGVEDENVDEELDEEGHLEEDLHVDEVLAIVNDLDQTLHGRRD